MEVREEAYQVTCRDLESKVESAEYELFEYINKHRNSVQDKVEEIKVIKRVLKNKDDEIARNKMEMNKIAKQAKANEKVIYNLENKVDNLVEANKKSKEANNTLKSENKKLEKVYRKALENRKVNEHNKTVTPKDFTENNNEGRFKQGGYNHTQL